MALRTDLDGLRIRMPGNDAVYLMDKGKKRHIPNPAVYNELFRNWDNIHLDLDKIDTGAPLPETAILFRCVDDPKVFLLDGAPPHQVKRHIANPSVMDRFQFNWSKIHVWNVPLSAIGFPDGDTLTKVGRPD